MRIVEDGKKRKVLVMTPRVLASEGMVVLFLRQERGEKNDFASRNCFMRWWL